MKALFNDFYITSIIICAVFGAGLILFLTTEYGPGLTPDSVQYLHASKTFYNTGEMKNVEGDLWVTWPPLFPLLLSFLRNFTGSLLHLTATINAFVFGASLIIMGSICQKLITNKVLFTVALIALLCSTPFIYVHCYLYSEPLFILFLSLFTLASVRYNHGYQQILIMAICSVLLFYQRYIGIGIIASGIWVILFQERNIKKGIKPLGIYLLLSCTPILIWFFRNYLLEGQIGGERSLGLTTTLLWDTLVSSHETVTSWFIPKPMPLVLRVFLFYTSIISVLYVIKNHLQKTTGVLIIIFGSFLLFNLFIFSITENIDYDKERYLSPLYFLAIIVFIKIGETIIEQRKPYSKLVFILLVIWALYPIGRTLANVYKWKGDYFLGYNNAYNQQRENIQWLKTNTLKNYTIYTNKQMVSIALADNNDRSYLPIECNDLSSHKPKGSKTLIVIYKNIEPDYACFEKTIKKSGYTIVYQSNDGIIAKP